MSDADCLFIGMGMPRVTREKKMEYLQDIATFVKRNQQKFEEHLEDKEESDDEDSDDEDCQCEGDSYFEGDMEMCSKCHFPHSREYERQCIKLNAKAVSHCGGGRWRVEEEHGDENEDGDFWCENCESYVEVSCEDEGDSYFDEDMEMCSKCDFPVCGGSIWRATSLANTLVSRIMLDAVNRAKPCKKDQCLAMTKKGFRCKNVAFWAASNCSKHRD